MQSTRLVTSALVAALSTIHITDFPVLWYYISNTILRRLHQNNPLGIQFPFPQSCRYKLLFHFTCTETLKALNRHWKRKYEMEYLMKGSSWALREIKSCWSWGFIEGFFINLITLKNCFLCMFFQTALNPPRNRHCSGSTVPSTIDRSSVVLAQDSKQGWQCAALLWVLWHFIIGIYLFIRSTHPAW